MDINPVAWFILKCTLEYPQKLAGQYRPLPKFALESTEFMEGYFKGTGKLTKKQLERNLEAVQLSLFPAPDVGLAWHVRAWGWWVFQRAKADRMWPAALYVVDEALADSWTDPTGGATHYTRSAERTHWTRALAKTVTIGAHSFYR